MLNVVRKFFVSHCVNVKIVKQISGKDFRQRISDTRLSFHTSYRIESPEKRKPNHDGFPDKRSTEKDNPKITLLSSDLTPTVIMLEQARRIAMRRDLKLVKVMDVDHKTQRPVYKLMTGAEYFEEDLIRRKEKSLRKNEESKDPKLVNLSYKISDHDLASKLKNIIKWLNKSHEVRITINTPGNIETADQIYGTIQAETKHAGKSVQKRYKGDDLKFQLVPLKRLKHDLEKNSAEDQDENSVEDRDEEKTPKGSL